MRVLANLSLLVGSLVAAGCASGGQGNWEVENLAPIMEADLADYQNFTALGVIRTLRPEWVATDHGGIRVFCPPKRQSGVGDLTKVMVSEIKEIRYRPSRQTPGGNRTYAYIMVTLKG